MNGMFKSRASILTGQIALGAAILIAWQELVNLESSTSFSSAAPPISPRASSCGSAQAPSGRT